MNLSATVQWSFDLQHAPCALRGSDVIFAAANAPEQATLHAFTPDGRWLISGSRDKTVKLRRIPSFEEIDTTERSEQAATARDRALRARGLPDSPQ